MVCRRVAGSSKLRARVVLLVSAALGGGAFACGSSYGGVDGAQPPDVDASLPETAPPTDASDASDAAHDVARDDAGDGAPRPFETRLFECSARLDVQTGEAVGTIRFVIDGSSTKMVIVRAIGPELTAAGVSNALEDPVLELQDSAQVLIARNDDWKSSQMAAIAATGVAPQDDRESAIIASLAPGTYTVIARAARGALGIALVDVYDLDPPGPSASRISRVSARARVGTGEQILFGGFIVQGPSKVTILARGGGPSLAAQGINGALANPALDLVASDGGVLASNDDWPSTQGAAISATGLAPTSDSEAAVLVPLGSAPYTVQVRGVGNTTGLGFVDLFDVP